MPFLLYRDGAGEQAVHELERDGVTIGRRAANDIALPWDHEVSRVHAELTRMGGEWVVCDEGHLAQRHVRQRRARARPAARCAAAT